MKISDHVKAIINAAYTEAKVRNHEYLTPEHILYAALAFDEVQGVFSACGANLKQLRDGLETYFDQKVPILIENKEPFQTIGFQNVVERAVLQSQSSQKQMLDIADILVSLYDQEQNYCAYYLRKLGVKRFALLNVLSHGYEIDTEMPFGYAKPGKNEPAFEETAEPGQKRKKSALERYATELTALARDHKLE
ncbi:MAG: ATP-dependent Clp protease ATP-binding subunit ClpA, partial [Spirochaetaceae bacterium]|nr:ATP-dependent Clp protease ATP-binding subunit ClpA [Spirochaetaceae bacterium]